MAACHCLEKKHPGRSLGKWIKSWRHAAVERLQPDSETSVREPRPRRDGTCSAEPVVVPVVVVETAACYSVRDPECWLSLHRHFVFVVFNGAVIIHNHS